MPSLSLLNLQNIKEVALLIIGGIITQVFARWFEKKPKVITYIGQTGIFKLKKRENWAEAEIATHSLVIRNDGKKPAKNVSAVHVNLPEDFVVFPAIDWHVKELQYGAKAIIFPNLAPAQQITIAYLYPPGLSYIHGDVSHDEGMAQLINVIPMRQLSRPQYTLRYSLIVTGLITWAYLIFFLLTFFQIL